MCEWGRGAKAGSTLRCSQAVPHPSTNRALCRLTSEVERDPVHSTRYGRQRYSFNCTSCVQFKAHTSIHRHRQAQTDTERADTDRHRQPQADTDRHTQPHTATQRQNDTKGRGEVCVCVKRGQQVARQALQTSASMPAPGLHPFTLLYRAILAQGAMQIFSVSFQF